MSENRETSCASSSVEIPRSTKRGRKLLEEIKRIILGEPLRIRMEVGQVTQKPNGNLWGKRDSYHSREMTMPACGTVGCIAGWAVALVDGKPDFEKEVYSWGAVYNRAVRLLAPETDSYIDFSSLFRVDCWPIGEAMLYYSAYTAEERARLVANRIDSFIRENYENPGKWGSGEVK
jgi:hypothetical protein